MLIIIAVILLVGFILFLMPINIKIDFQYRAGQGYILTVTSFRGLIKKNIDSRGPSRKLGRMQVKKSQVFQIIRGLIEKNKTKDIHLKLIYGSEDPALLAISIGLIWVLLGMILSYLFNKDMIKEIQGENLEIIPVFHGSGFEFYFSCIIELHLVHIITIYLRILKTKKGGEKIAGTPNRRLNENYND